VAERVWERYLTEQDKAHLAASRTRPAYGFGQRAAVLSIDNYIGAVGEHREPLLDSIKTWPSSTGLAGWHALDRTVTLLAAARAVSVPVIHTTGIAMEESGVPGWRVGGANRGYEPSSSDPDEIDAAQDRYRRRYDFVEQTAPLPGEVVIRKNSPSAFFGTTLAPYLIGAGIDTLIVCGESVSGCVRATVVDACTYRFHVAVVEECVYDRHEAAWAMNLFDIAQKYADVVSLEDTLAWLEAQSP
jgi:nicotinamidase-related amidase